MLTAKTHVEVLRAMLPNRLTGKRNGDHRDEQPDRRTSRTRPAIVPTSQSPAQQRPVADKARH